MGEIHRDDRGNLGVLLLLVVLALVSLLGLIWNAGEHGSRQQQVQNAADTSAHSAATLLSRSMNTVTAGNLLISQNASSEIIYRSIDPTRSFVQGRFDAERARATQLLQGNTAASGETKPLDLEYFEELVGTNGFAAPGRMTTTDLQLTDDLAKLEPDLLKAAAMVNYQPQKDVTEAIRRNRVALQWILNTFINGGPGNPGTPVAGGVRAALAPWAADLRSRLNTVLATIPSEQAVLDQFVAQTAPGLSATDPAALAQRRAEIFNYQQQVVAQTPAAIDEQRTQLVGFYKTNITHATPTGVGASSDGATPVGPPVVPASAPNVQPVNDNLRRIIPLEIQSLPLSEQKFVNDYLTKRYGNTLQAMLDPSVIEDPINVHDQTAAIWHWGQFVSMPTYQVNGVTLHGRFFIRPEESDLDRGWGFIYCAPLARYVNDRISRDLQGLMDYMRRIDAIRNALYQQVYPVPAAPYVALVPSIPDPTAVTGVDGVPNPAPIPLPPQQGATQASLRQRGLTWPPPPKGTPGPAKPAVTPVATPLPTLPLPGTLKPAERQFVQSVNERSAKFNKDMTTYCHELRALNGRVQGFTSSVSSFIAHGGSWRGPGAAEPTAVGAWLNFVEENRALVLRQIGLDKQFMVLNMYQLDKLPSWSTDTQYASAKQFVFETVYNRNIGPIREAVINQIASILMGSKTTDPDYTAFLLSLGYTQSEAVGWQNSQNWAAARARAAEIDAQLRISDTIVRQGAQVIAADVAAEWVARPWPFEIARPDNPTPPNPGISSVDRLTNFTLLSAAKSTEDTNHPLFFSKLFKEPGKPIVMYAQAETFNWMEFNSPYGRDDHYDALNSYGHGCFSSSPAPWRISTPGGWNWQPRLAGSDGLKPALDNNPQFSDFFSEAGVTGHDADALRKLNLH